jgi:hypothetical protein
MREEVGGGWRRLQKTMSFIVHHILLLTYLLTYLLIYSLHGSGYYSKS